MTQHEFFCALQEYLQNDKNGLKGTMKNKLSSLKESDIVIGYYPTLYGYIFEYTARGYGTYYTDETYRFPITATFTSPCCWFYDGDEQAAIKHKAEQVEKDYGSYKNYVKKTGFTLLPEGTWEQAIENDATGKLREEFKKIGANIYWLIPREVLEYTKKLKYEYSGKYAPVFGKLHNEDGTVETIRLGYVYNDNGSGYLDNEMGEEKAILDCAQNKRNRGNGSSVKPWVWIVGSVSLLVFPPVGIGFLLYAIIKTIINKRK